MIQRLGLQRKWAMLDMLILALAAAAAAQDPSPLLLTRDPPRGVTPVENRTLSQPHPYATDRTFPDLAVKGVRIEGDTLYVLVANEGKARARGPIRVTASAQTDRFTGKAAPARIGNLLAGESRWVPLRQFSVKSASAARADSLFALEDASLVTAAVSLPPPISAAVDRSGQACLPGRGCILEPNEANNLYRAEGDAIGRGRP
jgi:hypothetical protein